VRHGSLVIDVVVVRNDEYEKNQDDDTIDVVWSLPGAAR
jgi:hypothetical protein